MIRSGDDDRIINPGPFGDKFKSSFHCYSGYNKACSDVRERFLFGGLSLNHVGFRAFGHASYAVRGTAK